MPALIRNRGLELPFYPPETVVDTMSPITVSEINQTNFVRSVELEVASGIRGNLRKILKIADDCFDAAAEVCGAQTIEHEWGLTKSINNNRTNLIPKGFSLVADVAMIHNKQQSEDDLEKLRHKIIKFISDDRRKYYWRDIGIDQFTYGTTAEITQPRLFLHDVDIDLGKR